MFRRSKTDFTPAQLAQRMLLSAIARLGACVYLIYLAWKLHIDESGSTGAAIGAVALFVFGLVFLVITAIDVVKSYKNGLFNEETYYTEEYLAKVRAEQEEYARNHPEEADEIDFVQVESKNEESEESED